MFERRQSTAFRTSGYSTSAYEGSSHAGVKRQNMGLKPSRRPRFINEMYEEAARGVFDFDACNLRINKFYKAPIGEEDWSIKHIQPRARSFANKTTVHKNTKSMRASQDMAAARTTRLPVMRPKVQAAP